MLIRFDLPLEMYLCTFGNLTTVENISQYRIDANPKNDILISENIGQRLKLSQEYLIVQSVSAKFLVFVWCLLTKGCYFLG